jgi:hypothetical protein
MPISQCLPTSIAITGATVRTNRQLAVANASGG